MNIKISPAQTIIFLFISRAFTAITYTPISSSGDNASRLIGVLLSTLFSLIILIPSMFLFSNTTDSNIITVIHGKKSYVRNILSVLFALYFLWDCAVTVLKLSYFMTSAVFPNAKATVIIILFFVAVAYCVFMGIQGVIRTSTIVFVMLIVALAFIMFSSVENMNLLYVKPMAQDWTNNVYLSFMENFATNSELVLLLVLCKFTNKKFTKVAVLSTLFGGFVFLVVLGICTLILGGYIGSQVFPFYTVCAISEMGFLQRLDSIHMALWVIISLIKVSVFVLMSDDLIKALFPNRAKKISSPIILVLLFAVCLGFGIRLNYTALVESNIIGSVFIVVLGFFVPFIVLLVKKIGGGKLEK